MNIYTFKLGDLQTNTYLLEHDNQAILIDPADDGNFLTEEILRRRLTLTALVCTHGHFDHMLAVGELQANFAVPFYLNMKDQFLVDRAAETARHFTGHNPLFIRPRKMTDIGALHLEMGGMELRIIATPGHTPGSISMYVPDEECVFTGDTLFLGSIGRTDFSYASAPDMARSLDTLFALPKETIVYAGHGEITTIGAERERKEEYTQLLSR